MKHRNSQRYRNWIFLVYPESAPENWKEIITDYGVPWAHSPLHDKDKDEYGGDKKPHYHVLMKFSNLKSYQQMLSLTGKLCTLNPQSCDSLIGKFRYFLHLDNPEKYQYPKEEIQAFNGLDIELYFKRTSSEKNTIMRDIRQYIRDNNITEIADLIKYADEENTTWADLINTKTYPINAYINSLRNNPKHKFRQTNSDLATIYQTIKDKNITEIAKLYEYISNEEPKLANTMLLHQESVSDFLTSHSRITKQLAKQFDEEPKLVLKQWSESEWEKYKERELKQFLYLSEENLYIQAPDNLKE